MTLQMIVQDHYCILLAEYQLFALHELILANRFEVAHQLILASRFEDAPQLIHYEQMIISNCQGSQLIRLHDSVQLVLAIENPPIHSDAATGVGYGLRLTHLQLLVPRLRFASLLNR